MIKNRMAGISKKYRKKLALLKRNPCTPERRAERDALLAAWTAEVEKTLRDGLGSLPLKKRGG